MNSLDIVLAAERARNDFLTNVLVRKYSFRLTPGFELTESERYLYGALCRQLESAKENLRQELMR